MNSKEKYETATVAAGCFWKPQEIFDQLPGIIETTVGYTGGTVDQPTYEMVCRDDTGHAEGLQIVFDPSQITYKELLTAFWKIHDPTQVNRQGLDIGSQYRSAVFYHTPEQQAQAEELREELQQNYNEPIATEITAATEFFPAEEFHQKFYQKRG